MTKQELKDKLDLLGIKYKATDNKSVLEELLSGAEVAVEPKKKEEVGTEAVVHYNGTTRVYSQERHGENFRDLAKQFADQYEGSYIK